MTKNMDVRVVVFFIIVLFLLALFALISTNVMHSFAISDLGEFVGSCVSSCTTTG